MSISLLAETTFDFTYNWCYVLFGENIMHEHLISVTFVKIMKNN